MIRIATGLLLRVFPVSRASRASFVSIETLKLMPGKNWMSPKKRRFELFWYPFCMFGLPVTMQEKSEIVKIKLRYLRSTAHLFMALGKSRLSWSKSSDSICTKMSGVVKAYVRVHRGHQLQVSIDTI